MTVFLVWHGGASYSPGTLGDVETVDNLTAVRDLCESRFWNRDGSTPAVSDDSGASVFRDDPRGCRDCGGVNVTTTNPRPDGPADWFECDDCGGLILEAPAPDWLVIRGPRGGWRVTT